MKEFKMNSLIGTDDDGNDIIITDEDWIVLNREAYVEFFEEIRSDKAKKLIELTQISGQLPILPDSYCVHFVQYDLPVLIITSPKSIDQFFSTSIINVPSWLLYHPFSCNSS